MDGGAWEAAVHGVAKSRTRLSNFTFSFHFNALEKETAAHSSVLAWRIPGTGEPGGLPSTGSHRVGHDWSDFAAAWDLRASQVALVVKNLLTSAGGTRKMCSVPGWRRFPGGGQGNPLQYSCLYPRATLHAVAKHWRGLEQLSMHTRVGPKGSTKYVTCKTFQGSNN